MKGETMASPFLAATSRYIEWAEQPTVSKSLKTAKDKRFEWVVWTLVSISLLLALLGGTAVAYGVLQFDFPLLR